MKISCAEHRESLLLLTLRKRLEDEPLDQEEKKVLQKEIDRLEEELGIN